MIELKKEFTRKGVQFKQMFKNAKVVIYRLSRTYDNGITSIWYEVFKNRIHLPDKYHYDSYEVYPFDEAFGDWAWCCSSLKSLEKIVKREFPDDMDAITSCLSLGA